MQIGAGHLIGFYFQCALDFMKWNRACLIVVKPTEIYLVRTHLCIESQPNCVLIQDAYGDIIVYIFYVH